jgi:cell division protein FtsN
MRTERRHGPRMRVNGTAYVNLDPDNGGIILNISEGGLSFESRAPIERTETIRLWFSYGSLQFETDVDQEWKGQDTSRVSRFIEVRSELVWRDDTGKTGGIKFTNLSDQTRREIRDWMGQVALEYVNEGPTPPSSSVTRTYKTLARFSSARLAAALWKIQSARRRSGFSGGVVTGIVVSAFVVAVFSLFTHSRELGNSLVQLGNSLVQLGEQLGARSSAQLLLPTSPTNSQERRLSAPEPPPMSQGSNATSAESQTAATPIQAPRPERLAKVTPAIAKPRRGNPEGPSSDTPAARLTLGRPLVPRIVVTPTTDPDTSLLRAPAPEMELTNRLGVHSGPLKVEGTAMASEKYLEVGKFKEKPLADKQTSRLSQLGFPVKLVQRARFAGKSYQVLVGPYGNDAEAEAVHKDLASFGFTPRSYERGTRDFRLPRAFEVDTRRLPVGDCVISWESYTPDAIVKFEGDKGPRISVDAKWVKREAKYSEDAVVYEKGRDGSFNLIEIRFSGLAEALVLGRGGN